MQINQKPPRNELATTENTLTIQKITKTATSWQPPTTIQHFPVFFLSPQTCRKTQNRCFHYHVKDCRYSAWKNQISSDLKVLRIYCKPDRYEVLEPAVLKAYVDFRSHTEHKIYNLIVSVGLSTKVQVCLRIRPPCVKVFHWLPNEVQT